MIFYLSSESERRALQAMVAGVVRHRGRDIGDFPVPDLEPPKLRRFSDDLSANHSDSRLSVQEYGRFNQHLALLEDRVRVAPFLKAIAWVPCGRTIVDVGAGTGVWALAKTLLHKSTDDRHAPFPGHTHPVTSVMGVPSAVKPFRTATRTWNSAT
ncbi:hypothetical protein [Cereibacter sphaeroides]|uniref:hypothetical protein n=1 Tax=Cereibacter sphaeroides TaxID=1063 RepID=UPI00142E6898|nr:hypothetical protein [Cereibacter sphaeroides]